LKEESKERQMEGLVRGNEPLVFDTFPEMPYIGVDVPELGEPGV
jgi:hypothetical protein